MKRCPQCNRVETDEALKFCRVDGTTLISESSAFAGEAGTAQLGVGPDASEVHTSILPHTSTSPEIHRSTAPTTVLAPPSATTTGALAKPNRRKIGIAIVVIATAAIAAVFVNSYLSKKSDKSIESIAVMPFVNDSGNADLEYLSDGMTETLISSLSQIPELNVKARSSVFRYKGKETDIRTIGKELNVQAILNGHIIQRGQDLILNVELIDAQTENVLWSANYNRKQTDLISLQTEIARDVLRKLEPKLSGAVEQKLAKNYTENAEAYKLYLRGRFHWNRRTGDEVKKSVEYFEQAIEMDPSYALAFAGLADAYSVIPSYANGSPKEFFPKSKAAAKRALELDETLAEAHTALARVLFAYEWNFAESDKEYLRAIELNPNYPTAHHWYGNANLLRTGRFDESIAEMKRAQELDPLSLIINADLGENYVLSRRYDEGIDQLRKTIELDPRFYYSYRWLGIAYQMKGNYPAAIAEYSRSQRSNNDPWAERLLGQAYAASGNKDEAFKSLARLREIAGKQYVPPYHFAILYTALGDNEQAFQWLEKSFQDRGQEMTRLKIDPFLDPLRDDPRLRELMRKVGFPE